VYKPSRDYRFYYAHEALQFVEEMQCKACGYKETDDPNMPMCLEISSKFMLEEPIEEVDDMGDDGLVCTKYKHEELMAQEHPDQQRLV